MSILYILIKYLINRQFKKIIIKIKPKKFFKKRSKKKNVFFASLHTQQSALERGQEVMIIQIDFSAAFDRVNHQGILISCFQWVLEVCVVYIDTVSIRLITACYG